MSDLENEVNETIYDSEIIRRYGLSVAINSVADLERLIERLRRVYDKKQFCALDIDIIWND